MKAEFPTTMYRSIMIGRRSTNRNRPHRGVMKHLLLSAIIALGLGVTPSAHAQSEVTLIAPGGIQAAIEQLLPGFERKTGHKVKATFGSGNGTKQQVVRGEAFDV